MTLQQLKYFINVAETLNYSEAAKKLFVATSAISYGISNLEKELGVLLFDRKKTSIELTEEGKFLYGESLKILKNIDYIYSKMADFNFGKSDELRIGFLPSLLKPYFTQIIVPFINVHGEVKLSMYPMNLGPLMDAVFNCDVDVALTRSFHLEKTSESEIGRKELYKDNLSLLVYKGHPMSKMKMVNDLSSLKGEPFITVNPGLSASLYNVIIKLCAKRNYVPDIKYTVPNMDNVLTQVASHMGISIVPSFNGYYDNMPELCFIPIEGEELKADVTIAWNKQNKKKVIKEFLKTIEIETN